MNTERAYMARRLALAHPKLPRSQDLRGLAAGRARSPGVTLSLRPAKRATRRLQVV